MSGRENIMMTIIVIKHAAPSPGERIAAAYRKERRQISAAKALWNSGQLSRSGYRKRIACIGAHTDSLVHDVEPTTELRTHLNHILEAAAQQGTQE